eukprot:3064656-Amphidinium_carterae.1
MPKPLGNLSNGALQLPAVLLQAPTLLAREIRKIEFATNHARLPVAVQALGKNIVLNDPRVPGEPLPPRPVPATCHAPGLSPISELRSCQKPNVSDRPGHHLPAAHEPRAQQLQGWPPHKLSGCLGSLPW